MSLVCAKIFCLGVTDVGSWTALTSLMGTRRTTGTRKGFELDTYRMSVRGGTTVQTGNLICQRIAGLI
jgi:hypothetical protein